MPYPHAKGPGDMNHDYDDDTGFSDAEGSGIGQNPFDKPRNEQPDFDPFDDDTYEEPDRDTDNPAAYADEDYQEEEMDDLFPDTDLFDENENQDGSENEPTSATVTQLEVPAERELEESAEEETDLFEDTAPAGLTTGGANFAAQRWDDNPEPEADTPASWQDDDDFLDEGEMDAPPWPMGLIAVAVLALVLLVAGGYGVMQQRQATEEEILQLQAELATATSQQDVDQSRNALQEMKTDNAELRASLAQLNAENRRLTDTVAGLEAQLDAQQAVLSKASTPTSAPAPASTARPQAAPAQTPAPVAKPAAPAEPVAAKPAAAPAPTVAVPGESWFVNFGSYGQRDVARSWVSKLRPGGGETILIATEVNGRTLYRVRVVGLPNKAAAEQVARSLEKEYKLSKLWVGKQ